MLRDPPRPSYTYMYIKFIYSNKVKRKKSYVQTFLNSSFSSNELIDKLFSVLLALLLLLPLVVPMLLLIGNDAPVELLD